MNTIVVPICVHGVMRSDQCHWCEALCANCGHSHAQHTKGPAPDDYCRHCPCPKFREMRHQQHGMGKDAPR